MDSVLLTDLVERLHPPDRFHPNLRFELRTVYRAFFDLTHASVLLGRSLNWCLKFGVHYRGRHFSIRSEYLSNRHS